MPDDDGLDLVTRADGEPPTHREPPADRDAGRRAWGASTLVAICAVVAVLVAAWGAFDWVFLVVAHVTPDITFGPTEAPTPWGEGDDAQQAALRVLVGGAIALVGVVTAWLLRRSIAALLLGGFVAVCLVSGLAMHAAVTPDDPPAPRVPQCMEHSGEPNTCPGG
jgi:hypothetical protein